MLKNKIPILFIGFILGLIANYSYDSLYHKKVLKSDETPKQTQKYLANNTVQKEKNVKIPIFIQKDLNLTHNLTEEEWRAFLNKIETKTLKNIIFNSRTNRFSTNETLIHILCKATSLDHQLIKNLIDKGLNINAKNLGGATPMLLALRNANNLDDIKALVSMGADISMTTNSNFDALDAVLLNKDVSAKKQILTYLANEHGITIHNNPEKYLLSLGATDEGINIVKDLLPTLNKENYEDSLFHIAIGEKADNEVVNFFLEKEVNIDTKSFIALSSNKNISSETMQNILDKNLVDINDDVNGFTPLMAAISSGDVNKVTLYMKSGANPNLGNLQGKNAYDELEYSVSNYNMNKEEAKNIKHLLDNYTK